MEEIICGHEVEIVRKRNKNVIIRVYGNGKIKMTVPYGCSLDRAREFFRLKKGWVEKRLENSSVKAPETIENGAIVRLFGKNAEIRLVKGRFIPYVLEERIYLPDGSGKEKALERLYKSELTKKAGEYFSLWERKTGLKPTSVAIRKTVTRWGSCNHVSKRINLSLYLVHESEECISYVVLHELGHILYNDHGEGFKKFLDENMPNWRELRKSMRGQMKIN